MLLVREMPVLTTARLLAMNDKRLWRIVLHYVQAAMNRLDLSSLKAFSLDETKSRRGHRYVTIFIDLDRTDRPVVFAVAGKGRQTLDAFKKHLAAHGGKAEQVMEIVSDMSAAFIAGVKAHLPNRRHAVDWFHVVQLFTRAMDEGGRAEARETKLPGASRWATLKNADGPLTERQLQALAELMSMDMQTSKAWRIKEMLRWVRKATSMRGAGWRLSSFMHVALKLVGDIDLLKPVRKALKTVEQHREAILARWVSGYNNARIEALHGVFQAAKCRARGYRNDDTFICMIYLLAAPIHNLIKSTGFDEELE